MTLEQYRARLGLDVSRETFDAILTYVDILVKWSGRINLVGRSTLTDVWERHIVDSAQVLLHAPREASHWVDVGTGAGLPGLVLSAHLGPLGSQSSNARVSLVDSDSRKLAFVREAARAMGVTVSIIEGRIRELGALSGDVLVARGFAGLDSLFRESSGHLASGGVHLLHKGANFREELDLAKRAWDFRVEVFPSITDDRSVILRVGNLVRHGNTV